MLACLALNEKLYENIVELHGVIEELADTNVRILTEKNAANSSDDEFEYEISSVRRFGNLSDKSKQTSAREMPDYRFSYDERNMDKDIRQSAGR